MLCLLGLPSAFPYNTDQSAGVSRTSERGSQGSPGHLGEEAESSSVYLVCGMAQVSLLPGLPPASSVKWGHGFDLLGLLC